MNIMNVGYNRVKNKDGEDGLEVRFYYDDDRDDIFIFFDPPEVGYLMNMMAAQAPPEHVLVVARDMMNFTIH